MKVKIIYEQDFRGEILKNSYISNVQNLNEAQKKLNILYQDPCVYFADYEVIEEDGQ